MFLSLRSSLPLLSEDVWKVKQQKQLFCGDHRFFWKEKVLVFFRKVCYTYQGHNQAFNSILHLSKNVLILLKSGLLLHQLILCVFQFKFLSWDFYTMKGILKVALVAFGLGGFFFSLFLFFYFLFSLTLVALLLSWMPQNQHFIQNASN